MNHFKKISLILSACVGVCLMSLPCGCARNTQATIDKGCARLEAGDYAAAARIFARASRRINDSAPLYYNLGTAYHHMGRYDAAVSAFEAALRIDPAHQASGEHLGLTLIRLEAYDKAVAHLRALFPSVAREDRARILNALANAEKGAGNSDLACLRYLQAFRANPTYAPTYYNMGCLLHDTFQLFSEATDHFELYLRRAPAEDPHIASAREHLRRLRASGVKAPGQTTPPAGGRRNSSTALQAIREGDAHYAARRYSRAETSYARALSADYMSYDAAIRLGYARMGAGNFTEAIKAYQRAGEIEPAKIEPIYLQAHAAYSGQQLDQAGRLLTTLAIPRWPSYIANYQLMAYVRMAQKRIPEAIIYGQHYLDVAPAQTPGLEAFRKWLNALSPTTEP